MVLRNRFSANRFWDDIVEQDCTLFQYIGELCRYLVNSPPNAKETQHRLRLCCGNGLRSDVWETFQEPFQIPQIFEFYAATEANFSLYNCEGKPGAIGRIPPFRAHRFPVALVELDIDTAIRFATKRASACPVPQTACGRRSVRFSRMPHAREADLKVIPTTRPPIARYDRTPLPKETPGFAVVI
jgi:acyl-CoA synthetase (AMP-forming)/AMP-acid ligase II